MIVDKSFEQEITARFWELREKVFLCENYDFNTKQVKHKGCEGLCQLILDHYKDIPTDGYTPKEEGYLYGQLTVYNMLYNYKNLEDGDSLGLTSWSHKNDIN